MPKKITERRAQCSLHLELVKSLTDGDSRMKNIEQKLDTIMTRQLAYIETQNTLALDVAGVKAIVENGLQANVLQLSESAMEVSEKIQLLSDFAWFIDLVNDFRAGLVKRVFKYAFWGGVVALIYTALIAFGNNAFPKLAQKLF